MPKRYEPPEGWDVQAFTYGLKEPSGEVARLLARSFGMRRFAHNWALETIKSDLDVYHTSGIECVAPSLASLRKRWNQAKHELCVNAENGEPWWPQISKEVANDGIAGAVDGYWNWQKSRAGERKGPCMGFPKFHSKNKRQDSFTICRAGKHAESLRIVDGRRIRVPVIGELRTCESTRKLRRLIERGLAHILAVTIKCEGGRLIAKFRVELCRPQRHHKPSAVASRVGVDIGNRCLAVVADSFGNIIETVPNPKPLKQAASQLRKLNRKLARQKKGSNNYKKTKAEINRVHHRVACVRRDAYHKLTTRLAKTHGEIVIEDLNVAGMKRGKAKHISDCAMGLFRQQLTYKCQWYGSTLVLADRWFPSSKTCHKCSHVQDLDSAQHWTCDNCGAKHNRDENAAINLAQWTPQTNNGLVKAERQPRCEKRRPREQLSRNRHKTFTPEGNRTGARSNRTNGSNSARSARQR